MASIHIPFPAVVAAISLCFLIRFCVKFVRHRQHFRSLPSPPSSFLWGHIKLFAEVSKEFPPGIGMARVLSTISERYELDGIFCVDLWPLGPSIIFIQDLDLVANFSRKDRPKSDFIKRGLVYLFGTRSMGLLEGREWRTLRTLFAPAFSAAYLTDMAPEIIERVSVFASRVDKFADSGQKCTMFDLSRDLTWDVISKILLGHHFDHQLKPCDAERYHMNLVAHQSASWLNPVKNLWNLTCLLYFRWRLDAILAHEVRQRYHQGKNGKTDHKAVIDWLLFPQTEGKSEGMTSSFQAGELTSDFEKTIVDNVRSLYFAGHDNTAAFFCYTLTSFIRDPAWLARVRAEHDEVFGTDPGTVATSVMKDPRLLNQLPLTTACIKESLRMYAYSIMGRQAAEGEYIEYRGHKIALWGAHIQISTFDVHRNNAYWPDADRFDPSRFLEEKAADIRPESFRPFERGVRSCIGQELAMLEIRLLLLFTLRPFDFELAYDKDSPRASDRLGGYAYPRSQFTVTPSGGLPVWVKRRKNLKGSEITMVPAVKT